MPATDEFLSQVDLLYGHYLDCVMGFVHVLEKIVEAQRYVQTRLPNVDLDATEFIIGHGGDPDQPTHVLQHTTTQGAFKIRNSPGGENYVRATQNLIVLLFAYWDSGYRARIAQALGIETNELKVPIMGDLRLLRNDIVHCNGRLQEETAARLEVLKTFHAGQIIVLDKEGVFAMVGQVKAALANL